MSSEPVDVTTLLERLRQGSPEARDELIASLYDRFRLRAHQRLQHERPGHSLASGDLANEALIQLLRSGEFTKAANGNQLFRAFTRAMRQELIDHARRRNADKRGGDRSREELDDLVDDLHWRTRFDLLSLDEALQALAREDERVSEVLQMRFFGGCEFAEIAENMQVSESTIQRDARYGLSWLRDFLKEESNA